MLRKKENQTQFYLDPLARPDYVEADVQALRACQAGVATSDQQRRVIDWCIRSCGTYDTSYRRGGTEADRDTIFAEGKRWFGMVLVWMLKYAPSKTSPDKISVRLLGEQHVNATEQAE